MPSLARLGAATVRVVGTAAAKEGLDRAEAGELDTLAAEALRAEVEALAVLLVG